MRHEQTLFNLPPASLNILSTGLFILAVCVGVRVVKSPELAVKVANTSLITSSSANRLDNLAKRLEEQARVIEQKEQAYDQLQQTYNSYLTHQKGDIELGKAIEAIDDLPEVENIEQIQLEINETESDLLEVITE